MNKESSISTSILETLDVLVKSSKKTIVLFFCAEWSAPSQMATGIIERVVASASGQIHLVKIDADECPEIIEYYNVQGIPTAIIIKEGKQSARLVGIVSPGQYARHLEE